MEALIKEPEKLTATIKPPDFFLKFYIEDCPHSLDISAQLNDQKFVVTMGNLFIITGKLIVKNRLHRLEQYPQKSLAVINIIIGELERALLALFKIFNIEEKKAEGEAKSAYFVLEALGKQKNQNGVLMPEKGELVVKFGNYSTECLRKLARPYKSICEKQKKEAVAWVGQKSEEKKLTNEENRFMDVLFQCLLNIINKSYEVYLK